MDNTDKAIKTIEFTIITELGEFKLDLEDWEEENFSKIITWFKNGTITNFKGVISGDIIIFPKGILEKSILKYKEIK
jgi:hypothetical protein